MNEKDDFLYKHITETLKIDEKNFFNAGILVINNVCFVKEGVKDKCFKLLSTRKDLYFMDQCALNIICEGKVYYLDEKWNYESLRLYFVNKPEKLRIMENPAIVHYDGSIKPWNDVDMPLGEYFWKYARNSRFYETLMKKIAIKGAMEVLGTLGMVKKFRNIAVYGAGYVGKNYIDKVLALKICNIVVWVDKNYKDKGRTKIPVESPERLYETEFDHVVIAIEKKEIVEEVENMLCAKGIAKEKIIKLI